MLQFLGVRLAMNCELSTEINDQHSTYGNICVVTGKPSSGHLL